MVFKINGLTLSIGEREELLSTRAASLLGVPAGAVTDLRVIRKSVDARRARPPRFVYLVTVRLPEGIPLSVDKTVAGLTVTVETDIPEEGQAVPSGIGAPVSERRPVVVGCGPAGLFASLILAGRGMPVLLLERGKAVPERLFDVRSFWEKGILNPESHVHFGEGGAGTFSDGKLTSRVKNPLTGWVKRVLADLGAPAEILTDARPHIGTDRLREVVMNLRRRLVEMGCEVRFGAQVTDFVLHGGRLVGIVVNGSEEIRAERLILAVGQSADDTYEKLAERGITLVPKPFAVGFRVEHPQETINRIQYGRWAGHPDLPPADYFLTAKINRGIVPSIPSACVPAAGDRVQRPAGRRHYEWDEPFPQG